jgi:hypothetical protein
VVVEDSSTLTKNIKTEMSHTKTILSCGDAKKSTTTANPVQMRHINVQRLNSPFMLAKNGFNISIRSPNQPHTTSRAGAAAACVLSPRSKRRCCEQKGMRLKSAICTSFV